MSVLTDAIVNFQAASATLAQKQNAVDAAQTILQQRITDRDLAQKSVSDLRVIIETELDTINKKPQ
jgi:hypothetical protein